MRRFVQRGLAVLVFLSFFGCRWSQPSDSSDEVGTGLSEGEASLLLASPDLTDGGALPEAFHCEGSIPRLVWANAPEGTQSFALVVVSSWEGESPVFNALVMDIPATIASLEGEGQRFTSLILGLKVHTTGRLSLSNLFLDDFYYGPCETVVPSSQTGDSVRMEVVFTLYALDIDRLVDSLFTQEFGVGRFTDDTDLMLDTIESHRLGETELTAYADVSLTPD